MSFFSFFLNTFLAPPALGSYPITTQTPGRGLAAVAAQVVPLTSRKMIYSNTLDF
jgi:hypothetical protein